MQHQISVITLGIATLPRSRRFYAEGFGWKPVFENAEIIFYQMNGLMLGTWLQRCLEADTQRGTLFRPGAFALAHNVASREDVQTVIGRLAAAGGRVLRDGDAPPMADSEAMSPTRTTMPGRSPGIPLGRSMSAA
jgi:hypothetical protein